LSSYLGDRLIPIGAALQYGLHMKEIEEIAEEQKNVIKGTGSPDRIQMF
jgi:hypothetical protein